jgi:hypothetical protein
MTHLIDHLDSPAALLATRDQIRKVLKNDLQINLKKEHRLNEVVAHLLGAKDFQTAMGLVEKKANTDSACLGTPLVAYLHSRLGDVEVDDLNEGLIDLIYDALGTSEQISDLNNAGLAAQCHQLLSQGYARNLMDELTTLTDHRINDADHLAFRDGCLRCSTAVDREGYCQDDQCMYHDWRQGVKRIDTGDSYHFAAPKRLRVMATVTSDDQRYVIDFDCTDFFRDALFDETEFKETIGRLHACDWSGGRVTDEVALYYENGGAGLGHSEVKSMFDYLCSAQLLDEQGGFFCAVDRDSLGLWLQQEAEKKHRDFL